MKVISGGQTGVDRAALDVAMRRGWDVGGWCPRGRMAEDGPIPARYPLSETDSTDYSDRTRRNVRDSDAVLIIADRPAEGGTKLTIDAAEELGRPCLVTAPDDEMLRAVADWIVRSDVRTLNVAGPRESEAPGLGHRAEAFLERLLDLIDAEP